MNRDYRIEVNMLPHKLMNRKKPYAACIIEWRDGDWKTVETVWGVSPIGAWETAYSTYMSLLETK